MKKEEVRIHYNSDDFPPTDRTRHILSSDNRTALFLSSLYPSLSLYLYLALSLFLSQSLLPKTTPLSSHSAVLYLPTSFFLPFSIPPSLSPLQNISITSPLLGRAKHVE